MSSDGEDRTVCITGSAEPNKLRRGATRSPKGNQKRPNTGKNTLRGAVAVGCWAG